KGYGLEQHLGVGMAAPAARRSRSVCLQLKPEIRMVVDFAVESQHEPAVARQDRLMARGRKVDDRKPAVGEANASLRIEPDAFIIGTAMRESARHAVEQLTRPVRTRQESGDPAHDARSYP